MELTLNVRFRILTFYITLIIISALPGFSDSISESFDFSGRYRSSSWSSDSSSFAILWENSHNNTLISILESKSSLLSDPIQLPDHFDIRAFDWNAEGSGFVLKVFSKGITELVHIDRNGRVSQDSGQDGFQTLYPNIGLYINEAGLLALTLAGEGHPDIYVYKNNERVFSTDVYPGVIHCAGWKDGFLYCISDMDLSQGIRREERKNNGAESPVPEQMYRIDINKDSAVKSSLSLENLHFISPDNSLFIQLNTLRSNRIILDLKRVDE